MNRTLLTILVLGLVHGLLYVFMVPPWEHYDEPTHFEYAWLIADRAALPKVDDFDQAMRRAVAASMLEHGFFTFERLDSRPNLLSVTEPVWLGLSELHHPPAYYLLLALPLRLFRFTDITVQLYIARLVSLALYLFSLLCAWNLMRELFPAGHALRWMVPTSMALLPGYVDLMTAVNNDVGSVALFCLFLWGAVRLVSRKWALNNFAWTAGTSIATFLMKDTVLIAWLLLPLFVIFSLVRGPRRRLAWLALLAGTVVAILAVFTWDDAALWYRATTQSAPTRVLAPQAPLGQYALQVQMTPGDATGPAVLQLLPREQAATLRGKELTLGAWMWATQSAQLRTPSFYAYGGNASFYKDVSVGEQPQFYAFTFVVPENTTAVWISLAPADTAAAPLSVFYAGIVLAEGVYPPQTLPQFANLQAADGLWAGLPFHNLARNVSAQAVGPRIRPWADRIGVKYGFGQPSMLLASLLDGRTTWWYYWLSTQNMLQTFWGKFGWGGFRLLGGPTYPILALVTLLGAAGAALALWRVRRSVPWETAVLLGIALCAIWFMAMLRGTAQSLFGRPFIPGSRYAYPAIIPTLLLLNFGWFELLRRIRGRMQLSVRLPHMLFWGFFMVLDIVALLSVMRSYYLSP